MPDLIHFRHSFRGRHLRPHPPHCAHNLIVFGRVIPPTQLSDPNHPADDPFQMPIGIIQHFNASRSPAPPLGRRELISCLAIRVGDAGRDAIRRALHFVRDRIAKRIGSHDDASRDEGEKSAYSTDEMAHSSVHGSFRKSRILLMAFPFSSCLIC